jgi:hypothetical protein
MAPFPIMLAGHFLAYFSTEAFLILLDCQILLRLFRIIKNYAKYLNFFWNSLRKMISEELERSLSMDFSI